MMFHVEVDFAVESDQINIFDKSDEMIIRILANQTASALQNAKLYNLEQQRLKELDKAHAELAELNTGRADQWWSARSHDRRTPCSCVRSVEAIGLVREPTKRKAKLQADFAPRQVLHRKVIDVMWLSAMPRGRVRGDGRCRRCRS